MAQTRTAKRESVAKDRNGERHFRDEAEVARDVVDYLKEYAREKPEVAALWCFGLGFILGWKLKPW
jgi:hypothetical protein